MRRNGGRGDSPSNNRAKAPSRELEESIGVERNSNKNEFTYSTTINIRFLGIHGTHFLIFSSKISFESKRWLHIFRRKRYYDAPNWSSLTLAVDVIADFRFQRFKSRFHHSFGNFNSQHKWNWRLSYRNPCTINEIQQTFLYVLCKCFSDEEIIAGSASGTMC